MKSLFLVGLLSLAPMLTNAQPFIESGGINVDVPESHIASYLKNLEEQGYCIIPHILSTSEAELLYQRLWHEFIEKAWPNCRMEDRSNWVESFPMHNKLVLWKCLKKKKQKQEIIF